MIYNQDITLDLNTNTSYLVVGAKQGDNIGRTLTATILENGEPFRIPETTQASYRIRKPNGDAGWNSAEIYPSEHKVVITLTAQDLSTSGRCYADILLTVGTTRIGTVSFIIDVQAAPNIVEGALKSEAFGYLYDMVDQAGNIIETSQAWAEGKRSTDDVLGDSYSIYSTRGLDVSLDFETFKSTIDPPSIGKTTVYNFTYTSEGWEYGYNNELIDMSELGFTIIGEPDRGDIIEVTASFADPAWHNNSLYYRQRAEAWAVGTIDGTDVKDIYDLWHTDGLIVDFNYETFKQVHPLVPGETETYTFNYKNGNWQYNNQNVNMSSLGFTITAERLTNDAKIIVTTSDDTYKNNAKFYKEVIKNSRVGSVTTADPGKPAQASATFHVDTSGTDDAYKFDFTLPSIKPHATIDVVSLPEDQAPTAAVQVHDVPEKAESGEEGNLQKSFDFSLGIPKGVSAGFADNMSVVANTLAPGTNATAVVQVIDSPNTAKQFKFTFGLPTGATGEKGETGAQGPKGDTGNTGAQGPKGDTGAQGPKGDTGATGAVGPQGPAGLDGAMGQTGPEGPTGATGRGITNVVLNSDYTLTFTFSDNTTYTTPSIRGPQGPQGIQGATGAQGAQGPAGANGINGTNGINGINGQDAVSPISITIGSITEAAAGSPPSVTNSGTATNMILDFVLPTGAAALTIDDTSTSNSTTWSSEKISAEISDATSDIADILQDIQTLQTEVETTNTGLLDQTRALKTNVSNINTAITGPNGINVKMIALEASVSALQSEVETAATGLLARTTSLEGRMTAAETAINAANNNISSAQTAISGLSSKVGSGSISHSLGDNLVDAIDALWVQTFGVSGLATDVEFNKQQIRDLQTVVNRIQPKIEDTTSGLMSRVATLESTIQTKQQNLTFANNNGNLIIALAV